MDSLYKVKPCLKTSLFGNETILPFVKDLISTGLSLFKLIPDAIIWFLFTKLPNLRLIFVINMSNLDFTGLQIVKFFVLMFLCQVPFFCTIILNQ